MSVILWKIIGQSRDHFLCECAHTVDKSPFNHWTTKMFKLLIKHPLIRHRSSKGFLLYAKQNEKSAEAEKKWKWKIIHLCNKLINLFIKYGGTLCDLLYVHMQHFRWSFSLSHSLFLSSVSSSRNFMKLFKSTQLQWMPEMWKSRSYNS